MKPNYGTYIPGMALTVMPALGAMLVSVEKYSIVKYGVIFFAIILSVKLGNKLRVIDSKTPLVTSLVTMVVVFTFFEGPMPVDLFSGRFELTRRMLAIGTAFIPLVAVDIYWCAKKRVET